MKTMLYADARRFNQLSACFNSLELELSRARELLTKIRTEMSIDDPEGNQLKESTDPEVKLLKCSICKNTFDPARREFARSVWVPPSEVTKEMLTFGENKDDSRLLIHECSMSCIERAEQLRIQAGTWGQVPVKSLGHFKKTT